MPSAVSSSAFAIEVGKSGSTSMYTQTPVHPAKCLQLNNFCFQVACRQTCFTQRNRTAPPTETLPPASPRASPPLSPRPPPSQWPPRTDTVRPSTRSPTPDLSSDGTQLPIPRASGVFFGEE